MNIRICLLLVFYIVLTSCSSVDNTDIKQLDKRESQPVRRLNYDEIVERMEFLEPAKDAAIAAFRLPKFVVTLPERPADFGPDFYTVNEVIKLYESGKLSAKNADALIELGVQLMSGIDELDQYSIRWLKNRPEAVQIWWSHFNNETTQREFLSLGVNINPPYQPKYGAEVDYLVPPSPPEFQKSFLSYMENWASFFNDPVIGAFDRTKLKVNLVDVIEKIEESDEYLVFRVPYLSERLSSLGDEYDKNQRHNFDSFRSFLVTEGLKEEEIRRLEQYYFDTGAHVWHSQYSPGDYFSSIIGSDPQQLVENQLWRQKNLGGKIDIHPYINDLAQRTFQSFKKSIPKEYAHKTKDSRLEIVQCFENCTLRDGYLHAKTMPSRNLTEVSATFIRAANAYCYRNLVDSISEYKGLSRKKSRYGLLAFNYSERDFEEELLKRQREIISSPDYSGLRGIIGIDFVEEQVVARDFDDVLNIDYDQSMTGRARFEKCFEYQVSFLFAHELAHDFLETFDEFDCDCAAVALITKHYGDESFIRQGLRFLQETLLNTVLYKRTDLIQVDLKTAQEIEVRFKLLTSNGCNPENVARRRAIYSLVEH